MRCERHRPFSKHLSWNDRAALEKAHLAAGLLLQQCHDCRQWFFPWQMEEVPPPWSSGFRWVFDHPGLWMLWDCDSDHHCGWIHMDRPGRWAAHQRGRYLGTFASALAAAHALVRSTRKTS